MNHRPDFLEKRGVNGYKSWEAHQLFSLGKLTVGNYAGTSKVVWPGRAPSVAQLAAVITRARIHLFPYISMHTKVGF